MAGLFCVLALSAAYRGWAPYSRKWGTPHLYLNYSEGFVRRGLVGEVFHLFGLPITKSAWAMGSWLAMVALIVVLAVLAARSTHLHPLTPVALLASQFLPTMAFNSGYLDAYVFLVATLLYVVVARGWWPLAGLLGLIGPLVHEQFVFLLLPLGVVFLARLIKRMPILTHLVALACAGVAGIAAVFFSNETAAATLMNASGLPEAVVTSFLRDQLGQSIGSASRFMVHFWAITWRFALPVGLFFLLPALLMLGLNTGRVRRGPWLMAALSPLLMLVVAWDLSRIVVMCSLLTFVVLALSENSQLSLGELPLATPGKPGVLVAALLCFGYYTVPAFYAYPSYGYLLETGNTFLTKVLDQPKIWPPRPAR